MNRRGFLGSILALGVAPAIVRADSLMRIVPRDAGVWYSKDGYQVFTATFSGPKSRLVMPEGTIEALVFNEAHTAEQRARMYEYLSGKVTELPVRECLQLHYKAMPIPEWDSLGGDAWIIGRVG